MEQKTEQKIRYLVRIANVDLKGEKPIGNELRKIKGINTTLARSICNYNNLGYYIKTGELSEEIISKIEETIKSIDKIFPVFMVNRRKDFDEGINKHITGPKLKLQIDFDKKRLQKIKSRRGLRLQAGLPVRGQRTRGNFRKGKSLGVQRQRKK